MSEWIDAETRVDRANDLYEQGLWAQAACELKAAISLNPHNPGWYFNLALAFEAMDDYEHACESYRSAAVLSPNDVESLNGVGVNLTRLGKYDEALDVFQRIQQIDWTYEPSYCNRIVTYSEMGDHENAELMFYLARQVKDQCPLCYYNIANSLYARKRYDEAIRCWKETLGLDASHPQANARIAEVCWIQGDLKTARRYFEAELTRDGGDVDTMIDLGLLLIELNRPDEADRMFRRALDCDTELAAAHFGLGVLALKRSRLPEAQRAFRKTLELDPKYPGAQARLGEVLLRLGHVKQALTLFDQELSLCGNNYDRLRLLGHVLLDARQGQRANHVWSRLVQLSPRDAQARHNLGVSFFLMGRLEEGIEHCRKALKLKDNYPVALYNLALAHIQQGKVARARRYLARALTLAPNDVNIRALAKRFGISGFWVRLRSRLRGRLHLTPKHKELKGTGYFNLP